MLQTPERLFAYLSRSTTPDTRHSEECFHCFVSSQENGTNIVKFICKGCYMHLGVTQILSNRSNNPPCTRHLYSTENNQAHCIRCSTAWEFSLKSQKSPRNLLFQFMHKKDLSAQINALSILIFYLGNLIHDRKSINAQNSKFQEFVGINKIRLEKH